MPIQRLGRNVQFRNENNPANVVKTFTSLVHGLEVIQFRIEDALTINRLRLFGDSSVQELNGCYWPYKYPIRNNKASKA
jgi:hypothetical protein